MDAVTYIFLIFALMICCILVGFMACFIMMLFHKNYVVVRAKEEDEFECDDEDN